MQLSRRDADRLEHIKVSVSVPRPCVGMTFFLTLPNRLRYRLQSSRCHDVIFCSHSLSDSPYLR